MLKKEIKEIRMLAYLLAVCVSLFLILSTSLLLFNPGFEPPDHKVPVVWPERGLQTIVGIGTVMCACSYQQNLFPIYDSLARKTNEEYIKGTYVGLGFCFVIYSGVAIVSICLFGNTLQSSVLTNFGLITYPGGRPFWESGVIQFAFILLLMFHIPFVFFAGKEAVLMIVDELDRESVSKVLKKLTAEVSSSQVLADEINTSDAPSETPLKEAKEGWLEVNQEPK